MLTSIRHKISTSGVIYLFSILLLCLPLSVEVNFGVHQINLLSEPLIGILAIILFFKINLKALLTSSFTKEPISLAAIGYLSWMAFTIPFSVDLVISLKYFLVSLAYWWVFYIGFWYYLKHSNHDVLDWLHTYSLTFVCVVLYAWLVHAQYNFRVDISVMAARPFYKDHALYSAAMSLLFFVFALQVIQPFSLTKQNIFRKGGHIFFAVIFLLGIYLSFCRAAWLSLILTLGFGVWISIFKIRFHILIISLLLFGGLTFAILPKALPLLKQNISESKKGGWLDQVKSIGNITSDASNLERINRYSCAWRMFLDRPITGFGAGTYPSAYLPYQKPEEMTRLSVTTTQMSTGPHYSGRGGSTHSEYLQALSELGLPGFLCFLAIVGSSLFTGMIVYYNSQQQSHRRLAMALLLGVSSYFIHTLLNNFLHSDKIAALFWAMLAALAVLKTQIKSSQIE